MYVVVRTYEGVAPDLLERIRSRGSSLTGAMSGIEGFRDYHLIDTGGATIATVGVFTDRAGTEESTRVAGKWLQDNGLADRVPTPPTVVAGEVALTADASSSAATPTADQPRVKVKVYKAETNLRQGGSTRGPDNVLAVLGAPKDYDAIEQCTGQDVTEEGDKNFWWVKIDTGTRQGWVSAVRIQGGGNDEPIKDVPQKPTRFC